MEAIHGRQSVLHNAAGGALLGYIGVSTHKVGIPFVDQNIFWRYPGLRPPMVGAAVYGAMAGAFGLLGGKSI